ncbi:RNA exonuclease ngl2 [Dimargaris cristalligena]|uniref:Endonuclease/exonuclease/phosphatase n=1 Tax=Dimargaris cristalligena TaxID=215637 RepID=A0A4Q0A2Y7_9FUNG|nr:RNA exonuclease ngl2 [Dimargaris cristalligena]RKP39570.1 Endonuclease/exonuclease/phosphatase [Dimargaris cristalligena]|eukprot:RKP39570.1 Endonuclease/exonuclease/phosphatase [Dimargaris cristalligena]
MTTAPLSTAARRMLAIPEAARSVGPMSSFKFMTWNALAQTLVRRELYPYCTKAQLKWKSRKQRLLAEFEFYRPDVACFQEIDRDFWLTDWAPVLDKLSYHWRFFGYPTKNHGCCLVWRSDTWSCLDYRPVLIDQSQTVANYVLTTDNVAQVAVLCRHAEGVKAAENQNESHTSTFQPSASADSAQAHAFTSEPSWSPRSIIPPGGEALIVSNTHLYWNPQGGFNRLAQGLVIHRTIAELNQPHQNQLPVVMAGDFNTTPVEGLYPALHHQLDAPGLVSNLMNYLRRDPRLFTLRYDPDQRLYLNDSQTELPDPAAQPLSTQDHAHLSLEQQNALVCALLDGYRKYPPARSVYQNYDQCDPAHFEPIPEPVHRELNDLTETLVIYQADEWHGEPRFSTFTQFRSLLDYIMVLDPPSQTDNISAETVIRPLALLSIPKEELLVPGLPNDSFPSDHLSLLADLGFFRNGPRD